MKERGIALIMTLWVLVLLTAVAMNLSFSTRHGSRSTRTFKEDAQAYYLAVSAYEEAIAYLLSDKDPAIDFVDAEGNFYTDDQRAPITGTWETEGAVVTLTISDEESRVNINRLRRGSVMKLLESIGVPDDQANEIADSLADWQDADDMHHLQGAEDEYYMGLGYRAKNGIVSVPEELMLVKGATPEYYYGTEDGPSIHSLITTWGSGINVNTASADVLSVLGLSPVEIDTILSQRESLGGLRAVPPNKAGISLLRSFNFRIQVEARMNDSPITLKITSVVRRTEGPDGLGIRTLYWKEGFESSRA